jgi:hypothetical protein
MGGSSYPISTYTSLGGDGKFFFVDGVGVYNPTNWPPGRHKFGMTASLDNRWIAIHGGHGYSMAVPGTSPFIDDLWLYRINLGQWALFSGVGAETAAVFPPVQGYNSATIGYPGYRVQHSIAADAFGDIWLYGGRAADIWRWEQQANAWHWVSGTALPGTGNTGLQGWYYQPASAGWGGNLALIRTVNEPSTMTNDADGNVLWYGGASSDFMAIGTYLHCPPQRSRLNMTSSQCATCTYPLIDLNPPQGDCGCRAGWYGPLYGPCQQCPNGTSSSSPAKYLSNCFAAPGYFGPNGEAARKCPPGCDSCTSSVNCTACKTNYIPCGPSWPSIPTIRFCTPFTNCSICPPAYYGNNGPECSFCPVDSYCEVGNRRFSCDDGGHSPIFSTNKTTDCTCGYGKYKNNGVCQVCPLGYWCAGDTNDKVVCDPGSTTLVVGASAASDCTCLAGYYFLVGSGGSHSCPACEASNYCSDGTNQTSCGAHRTSVVGSDDPSDCTCVPGYTGVNGATDTCTICEASSYCPGRTASIPCGFGATSTSGSKSISDCHCNAGYYGPSGPGPCSDCPVDSFCVASSSSASSCGTGSAAPLRSTAASACVCKPTYVGPNGKNTCTLCTSGRYCAGGSTDTACPANSFCTAGVSTPTTCGIGASSGSNSTAASECSCSPGYFGPNGKDQCNSCSDGYYCPGGTAKVVCPANSFCVDGVASPTLCGTGSISPTGSISASSCSCAPGYVGPNGQNQCTSCVSGRYCGGGTVDAQCPMNSFCVAQVAAPTSCGIGAIASAGSTSASSCSCSSNYVGPTGQDQCVLCAAGRYCVGGATDAACPANSFCTAGVATPTPCGTGAGSNGSSTAASNCRCGAGYFGPNGRDQCSQCTAGYYCSGGTTRTGACPPNFYCAAGSITPQSCGTGAMSSISSVSVSACSCAAGYLGPNGQASNCTVCPRAGYYCPGGPIDVRCPANSFCPVGSPSPTSCGVGAISSTGSSIATECSCGAIYYGPVGKDQCSLCTPNYFCLGGTSIISCGVGSVSLAGASAASQCSCQNGYFGSNGQNQCVPCTAGYYCEGGPSKIDCPANYYCGASSSIPTACGAGMSSSSHSESSNDCSCSPGYSGPNGVGPCALCTAGFYCLGGPTDGPLPRTCPSGSYCPSGANTTTFCPLHSSSLASASTITDCRCVGSYVGPNGGPCEPCSAGRYCTGGTDDHLCDLNSYCPAISLSSTACPNVHLVAPKGSDELSDCKCIAGYFGVDGGPCAKCQANYFCLGGTNQTWCGVGSESVAGSDEASDCSCSVGFFGSHGKDQCEVCPPNSYCSGSPSCTSIGQTELDFSCVCLPRYFGSNNSICNPCNVDHYCEGGEVQSTCPDSSTAVENSRSITACKCLQGFTGVDGATCDQCAAGTYKPSIGSAACTLCPLHSGSPAGSSSLDSCSCNPGATGNDAEPCTLCPIGKYKSVPGSATCTPCSDLSAITLSMGSTSAAACVCQTGWEPSSTCVQCVAGKFGSGSLACQSCPTKSTSAAGSSLLLHCQCIAGYTGANGAACTACPTNSFKSSIGSANCTSCPDHSSSPSAASVITACICSPGFGGMNGEACGICGAGNYSRAITGGRDCVRCPAGRFGTIPQLSSSLCNGTCLPGSYCPAGSTTATGIMCPPHSDSQAGSTSATACKCLDGYGGPNGGPCDICEGGTYSVRQGDGHTECISCPAGVVGLTTGMFDSLCSATCSPNYYCPSGSSSIIINHLPLLLSLSCLRSFTSHHPLRSSILHVPID